MTLPQNLMRAMRTAVAEWDDLQPEDAPSLGAAIEVFRGYVNRENGRAKVKRKVQPSSRTAIPAAVRRRVAERSRGLCEVGALGCTGKANHLHHRLMRSQGGSNKVDNLLATCASCHRTIHAQPAWSYERGFLLHAFGEQTG